ncbi:hypothetical protein TVAG_476330 [Trichomonas vaginalis G3]|uniref:Glycosyltransferase 61 catalytic domain-containing protein n=1 Tax=Trichomonas vaginalis (strain ATCC PRA-98 / G3) TaxID=412133 RepID=A2DA56_TRIV3|nr:glycosyltransferase family [Trichomonas vaginalis G3]EAY22704.1 hypothetical protein TVAG_476330 [Trichomonas vaginalis G3]KAI5525517.1 glycosyltransferase family [Trichomonas vaginalis G3]|eukprot:XP_001583690.1 hypothetical protein [Trichomonas vaginalis G3]
MRNLILAGFLIVTIFRCLFIPTIPQGNREFQSLVVPILKRPQFNNNSIATYLNITHDVRNPKIFNMEAPFKFKINRELGDRYLYSTNNYSEAIINQSDSELPARLINQASVVMTFDAYTARMCATYTTYSIQWRPKSCYKDYIHNGSVVGKYDTVISICHHWLYMYGHQYLDFMSVVLLIPEQIRNTAYIVLPAKMEITRQLIELLGIPRERQIEVQNSDFIHANVLYSIVPGFCIDSVGELSLIVRSFLFRHFNLVSIKCNRYVLYNRDKKPRIVQNYPELCELANKTYPNYPWEKNIEQHDLKGSALYYASIKFMWTISGSVLGNIVYFQPFSIICEVTMKESNLVFFAVSSVYKIHHVILHLPNNKHFDRNDIVMNTTLFLKIMDKGVSLLK